jgi:hypothetical protein
MRKTTLLLAALSTLALAGCLETPGTRALAGAATGAVISDATGGDALTGAVIGGLGGAASCGISGLPRCR